MQIFRQALSGFDVRFLDHIAGIDAALQAWIEAQTNHAAQPFALGFQQLTPSVRVSLAGTAQKARRFA